jgi:hypothetical protein
MNVKRTLALGAGGAVLAALLASAATSGNRRVTLVPVPKTTEGVDMSGAALAAEIARLHDRLHPTTAPQQPARNLFEFGAARAPGTVAIAPEVPRETMAPAAPPAPAAALNLLGIAEDVGPDGPIRTAIISGSGELFLAKEGEAVTLQYRVAAIAGDGVELRDVNDGTTVRLDLK